MYLLKYRCTVDQRRRLADSITRSNANVECINSDYSVQNDESLHGHCTNERRVRKRDKKVRRDVI